MNVSPKSRRRFADQHWAGSFQQPGKECKGTRLFRHASAFANKFVIGLECGNAAFAPRHIHVVIANAQTEIGAFGAWLCIVDLDLFLGSAPAAMSHQFIVLGVGGEEAEQRGTAIVFIIDRDTAEIIATGGNVDGFINDALARIFRLVIAHGPASEIGNAWHVGGHCRICAQAER